MLGRSGRNTIDQVARRLARGMSRREALQAGGAAVVGAMTLRPTDAWAAVTGICPRGHVKCRATCCPVGEVCLGTGTKAHCGCHPGLTRCGSRCVNLHTNHANCGRCGHACGSSQVCSNGHCVTTCASGQTNCSGACVNTSSDVHNCGACGHACTVQNGLASCTTGACGIASCSAPYANCTNNYADGCNVNTYTDPQNCGGCGMGCSVMNGTAGCNTGQCVISQCNAGYQNCDGHYSSGCNVHTDGDPQNCGGCGMVCTLSHTLTAGCSGGQCTVVACEAGWGDCNATPSDGCETDLTTTSNCGQCGNDCTNNNSGHACVSGHCGCNADSDCATGSYCNHNNSTCAAKLANGQPCTFGQQCQSGVCTQGLCT